jgi:GT2 family glycosyltransferase
MLSIIVLAYNNWEYSRRCLESLVAARLPAETEVLFVDNASTDDTVVSAPDHCERVQNCVYVRNPVNLTCSQALNQAAARARGTSLLFLNNDVLVEPLAIVGLCDALHGDDNLGAVAPRLLFPAGNVIQHAGVVPMLWGYPINNGTGALAHDPRFATGGDAFAVTGAMVLVRRSSFERVGGFDEGFVWGFEDIDLCLRLREAGDRVRYVAITGGTHYQSLTIRPQTPAMQANYMRYRRRWEGVLAPRERTFLDRLESQGARQVLIWGAGQAARLLHRVLAEAGFAVQGFIDARPAPGAPPCVDERPVWNGPQLCDVPYDVLLVASQFYYAQESQLPDRAVFPIV